MGKTIKIDHLSRVEGEGGFIIEIKDGKISRLNLKIFEAPRFFESFLMGRDYSDVIDFTARICGICPVAYQMSAVHAIEKIFGVNVERPIHQLRRLLYCVEWIESHALHVYLLNGPDFYGLESAWSNKEYLEIAKRGLKIKKLGNEIVSIIGGRSIHPVSVRVGGFYKLYDKKSLTSILPEIEKTYEESLKAIKWASSLPFTDSEEDREYVSLSHDNEYPMNEGYVLSNRGINMPMDRFMESTQEYQLEHSTALYSGIKRDSTLSPYLVGPVARLNLNHALLPDDIKNALKECAVEVPIKNTQMGIIARSVEIAYAFHEAMRLIKDYEEPNKPFIEYEPCAGEAVWITEAPRGMLIHRYEIDERGKVKNCSIIPPTSQNMAMIERDLYRFVQDNIEKSPDFLKRESAKIIRSYDPCISCSVHVVKVKSF